MRASKHNSTPWSAFVEYMNQIYFSGCMEVFDQATIAFHYHEFCEGHTF